MGSGRIGNEITWLQNGAVAFNQLTLENKKFFHEPMFMRDGLSAGCHAHHVPTFSRVLVITKAQQPDIFLYWAFEVIYAEVSLVDIGNLARRSHKLGI